MTSQRDDDRAVLVPVRRRPRAQDHPLAALREDVVRRGYVAGRLGVFSRPDLAV